MWKVLNKNNKPNIIQFKTELMQYIETLKARNKKAKWTTETFSLVNSFQLFPVILFGYNVSSVSFSASAFVLQ